MQSTRFTMGDIARVLVKQQAHQVCANEAARGLMHTSMIEASSIALSRLDSYGLLEMAYSLLAV
jgi:hypothetical protein